MQNSRPSRRLLSRSNCNTSWLLPPGLRGTCFVFLFCRFFIGRASKPAAFVKTRGLRRCFFFPFHFLVIVFVCVCVFVCKQTTNRSDPLAAIYACWIIAAKETLWECHESSRNRLERVLGRQRRTKNRGVESNFVWGSVVVRVENLWLDSDSASKRTKKKQIKPVA